MTLTLSIFLPIVFAAAGCFIKENNRKLKNTFVISASVIVFALSVYNLFTLGEIQVSLLSFNFTSLGFQRIYAAVTAFMWMCASFITPEYFNHHGNFSRYSFFFLMTLGATLGVFCSADLITTFIFFEVMSFTSYTWVVQEQNKESLSAGKTYLTVAVIGGMVCLMGLFLLYSITGTLMISELSEVLENTEKTTLLYVSAFCMLVGFGAKAGLFPLHIWLPKAHPVAPAPASALLSGVLTKTGIFGMLIITSRILKDDVIWGNTLLVLGCITMVLGAVLAVFSLNLKRTLACSSLSQIGFINVGIAMISLLGEENALAANGTVLYMLNHSVVKLALFLSAGAIYTGAHTLDINKLKGYGRNKPVIFASFLIGACSLAGIPGFCGYLSKTLVHESIVEYAAHSGWYITAAEWLFLLSGGLTTAYMIKLFVTIFIEKPDDETPKGKTPNALSSVALILAAVALPVAGVLPHALSEKISLAMIEFIGGHHFHHEVHYFSFANLKGIIISLTIGIAVYFIVIRKLLMKEINGRKVHTNPFEGKFSVENNIYKPLYRLVIKLTGCMSGFLDKIPDYAIDAGMKILAFSAKVLADFTDLIIYALSRTVFIPDKEKDQDMPHKYSYALGEFFDKHSKNRISENESNADLFASVSETISKTTGKLSHSFSFALFMTCLGICLILLFLIFSD